MKRIDRSRSTIAATAILALCTLYVVLTIINEPYVFEVDDRQRRFLRSSGPVLSASGKGPELAGVTGDIYKFHGEAPEQGVTWYNVLSSPRLTWNMAPYHWKTCPHMFLGDTGFTFHEPDINDPTKVKSRYMRFRMERRDDRSCLWNHSKTCLAGGNFVMNLGQTARDILNPGDFTLKTNEGVMRIVAYNTNRACSRRWAHSPAEEEEKAQVNGQPVNATSATSHPMTPIEYLRQAKSSMTDPQECEAWIKEREEKNDIFSINSDMATVIVDTPWMHITIQVRQNKVATDKECNYAKMDIWITNMSDDLGELTSGVLGQNHYASSTGAGVPSYKYRALSYKEGAVHKVDGPFGTVPRESVTREKAPIPDGRRKLL